MVLRAWRLRRVSVVVLFALMLVVLIINGVLLLQAGHVWPAIAQSAAILVVVGVSSFLYHRIWLEIQRRRVLRELGDTLTDNGHSVEFLDRVVHTGVQLFPLSDRCTIHLLDETGEKLRLVSSNMPKVEGLQPISAGQGIAREILRELKPRLIPDTRQVPGPLPIDPGLGRGCLVIVPLKVQGKALGLLSLYSHIPGAFAKQDRLLLSLLGVLASAALDRARLESVSLGEAGLVDGLVGNLADGVVVLDQDDRILYYNASLAPLLGADMAEVMGKKVYAPSENLAAHRLGLVLGHRPASAEVRCEFQVQLDDPFPCSLQVYVFPVLDQQGQWKKIVVLHDHTLEMERVRTQSDLIAATLQESEPSLQSIRSYATLLQREQEIGTSTMPWAGLMHDHSVRLMRLVRGLEDVLAILEKSSSLNLEVTPLWPLVRDVLAELAEQAQRAGVSFDLHFPPDLSSILCDPDRLRHILFFIVDNALHRGTAGGRIRLEIRIHCAHLVFSITDDGHPVPTGTWERIQRGLNPSRASLQQDPYDTGLGLYLGRKLVEVHGGHLWMDPHAERGAALHFVLPYHPVMEQSSACAP